MMRKYGPAQLAFPKLQHHLRRYAERQDAMFQLVDENWTWVVVVNIFQYHTPQRIAIERVFLRITLIVPSGFPGNRVEHRLLSGNLQVTENWLPEVRSGITSEASTPDKVVADVVEKIFELGGRLTQATCLRH